jgi:ABC-type uncharacterized transport system auxiliary subunit
MTRKSLLRLACLALAALSAACGPASVRPTSYADPGVPCPGAQTLWNLEIVDRRAERVGADQAIGAIRDGIHKSFPGCRWAASSEAGAGTISIEVHRFTSQLESGSWEAAVEWSVRATNAGGRTLTEFESNEEVSRPNYRGSDNEKESLSQAFQKALERTVKGLRALPAIDALRPREGTAAPPAGPGPGVA